MSGPSAKADGGEASEAVTQLMALWQKAYPPGVTPTRQWFLKGNEDWDAFQPKHLPLTLDVMMEGDLDAQGQEIDVPVVKRFRAADPSTKAVIVMVGYSMEQVALCLAYQRLKFGCFQFIPFLSKETKALFYKELFVLLKMLGITVAEERSDQNMRQLGERVLKDTNDPSLVFGEVVSWEARTGMSGARNTDRCQFQHGSPALIQLPGPRLADRTERLAFWHMAQF
jgi:hypothetical protein